MRMRYPKWSRVYCYNTHGLELMQYQPRTEQEKGDEVKRGQHVADAGELVKGSCGGGMEHLHFHMSKIKGGGAGSWGSWRFLGKPSGWINLTNIGLAVLANQSVLLKEKSTQKVYLLFL